MFNAKDEEIRELLVENNNLWFENTELKEKIFKAMEILNTMKHCELLLGGNKKSNIDKLLEILGDKENV